MLFRGSIAPQIRTFCTEPKGERHVDPRYGQQPHRSQPRDMSGDAEARYRDMQAAKRQRDLAPATWDDESREQRADRGQRNPTTRQDLNNKARQPVNLKSTLIVVGIVSICALLCVISIGGGILLSGTLNRTPDITSTASLFYSALRGQDYGPAHDLINSNVSQLQQFTQDATDTDRALGHITTWKLISQQGGGTNAKSGAIGSALYQITRAGGTYNAKATPQHTYNIAMTFSYSGSGWQITGYDDLFDVNKLLQSVQAPS